MERISSFFLPLLSFSFASQLFFSPFFAKVERISFKCYNIIVIKKEKEKKDERNQNHTGRGSRVHRTGR